MRKFGVPLVFLPLAIIILLFASCNNTQEEAPSMKPQKWPLGWVVQPVDAYIYSDNQQVFAWTPEDPVVMPLVVYVSPENFLSVDTSTTQKYRFGDRPMTGGDMGLTHWPPINSSMTPRRHSPLWH